MEKINAITFAPFEGKGRLSDAAAFKSLKEMKARTNVNWVILVPAGLQQTPYSETISISSGRTMPDEELAGIIRYAKELGLKVAVKPTVNCENGVWRAHINFFDEDVHCEPKWSKWFPAYTAFQLHYANIAEAENCEMFIAGCEMVMTERREGEWRKLIADIREVYHGQVSYNTDKYQEHNVKWWDCVDIISSSGYYPINDWEQQLDRIERVVKKFNKPFFFAEAGCMSVVGSQFVPNDWGLSGEVNAQIQAEWYQAMFEATSKRDWVGGYGLWSWPSHPGSPEAAARSGGYEIYGKPAEQVVKRYFSK